MHTHRHLACARRHDRRRPRFPDRRRISMVHSPVRVGARQRPDRRPQIGWAIRAGDGGNLQPRRQSSPLVKDYDAWRRPRADELGDPVDRFERFMNSGRGASEIPARRQRLAHRSACPRQESNLCTRFRKPLATRRRHSRGRPSHNPEVAGSNPAPATSKALQSRGFSFRAQERAKKLLAQLLPARGWEQLRSARNVPFHFDPRTLGASERTRRGRNELLRQS